MKKVVVKASLAIMAAATVLGQGALIPVGAPAPSMKTLDQIEPRTVITSLPCIITQPGGYVLGQHYTTGSIWSANAGWITLGSGTPANGFSYANDSASDWGVNLETPGGKLRGFAYGANIGWIAFTSQGDPQVNLASGALGGYAYGANIGWISLANSQAFVQTDWLSSGPDSDGDGIPDTWEYQQAGDLTTLLGNGHDADGDGVSDLEEYLAGSDPLDANSILAITAATFGSDGTQAVISWRSSPARLYRLEATSTLAPPDWQDCGLGLLLPGSGTETTGIINSTNAPARFYRVRAMLPLAP